jgi:hypothetical protein
MSLGLGFSLPAYFLSSGAFAGASLNLDFTSGNQTLDPRITFSRTSNATLTNSAGLIAYAPHNLLSYSEQFDNAVWNKFQATVSANVTVAPDGTITADKLIEGGGAAAEHGVNRSSAIAITAGASVTLSVYAKADTRSRVSIVLVNGAYSVGVRYTFNIATGAVSAVSLTGSPISYSASAQNVGGGWYRCVITVVLDASSTTANLNIATDNGTSFFYAGDGTSGLFIWGAQLNVGALQPYYTTTVKNLLGYTQEFGNAAWVKTRSSISSDVAIDPQGYMTADKLIENTDNSTHFVRQSPSLNASAPHTVSGYLKADERTEAIIRLFNIAGWAATSSILVNLLTGSVVVAGSGATGSATDVGNGWYRVAITQSTNATTGTKNVDIFPALNGTDSYQGDGTSGIFIWGAQLSDSASLDPYVYNPVAAPAAAAYYGPRFDYDPVTLAPKGLLIEEQRTNLVLQSGWAGATTGTPGAPPASPWSLGFGAGTETTLVNSIYGSADGAQAVRFNADSGERVFFQQGGISVTSGVQYALSVYLEQVSGLIGDLLLVVSGTTTATQNTTVQNPSVPGRYTILFTANGTGTVVARTGIGCSNVVSATCSATLSRPQVETGAFATSYIPTTTATVTRAADVATMIGANFSNWYNQSEGTLFSEYINYTTATGSLFSFDDNTINNRIITLTSGGTTAAVRVVAGGVNQVSADIATVPVGTVGKIAFAYKLNDFAASANASTVVTDTSGTVPAGQIIARIGSNVATAAFLNGPISRIAYYNRRLANTELQGITS